MGLSLRGEDGKDLAGATLHSNLREFTLLAHTRLSL